MAQIGEKQMIPRRNMFNNMSIQNYRRNPVYQAVMTDLCLEGIISKEKAEEILGYEMPSTLKGPSGKTLAEGPKKESSKKKAEAPPAESAKEE